MDPYIYKYYLNFNYFLENIQQVRSIKINEVEQQYLYCFVYNPQASPYDIASDKKMLVESGLDIKLNSKNYRRAKIVVKKLYNLKLICLTSKKNHKNLHDKKFYSLTDLGLFYLFRSPNFLRINIQTIIKNYSHFKMFDDLLYPYIQLGDLKR